MRMFVERIRTTSMAHFIRVDEPELEVLTSQVILGGYREEVSFRHSDGVPNGVGNHRNFRCGCMVGCESSDADTGESEES